MIVTVALNPAVDKVLIVPGFKSGATNRATVDRVDVGGKGINVALTLKRLGCEVLVIGFIGAHDRYSVATTLTSAGVEADFVPVPGETRVNLKMIDPLAGVETEINEPGFAVPPDAVETLLTNVRTVARRASVMVFSGSLPPEAPIDLYARLIALAGAAGVRTVLDTAGTALAHGLAAGPDLVKPNRAEAEELLDRPIGDEAALAAGARRILELGARSVVVSIGGGGALSASSAGLYRARPPAVAVRSAVGAGDAMVAALAIGLMKSLPPAEALRLATAVSCATIAGADQPAIAKQIESLLPRVSIGAVESTASVPGSPAINR